MIVSLILIIGLIIFLLTVVILSIIRYRTDPPLSREVKYTGLKIVPNNGTICFDSSNPSTYEKYENQIKEFVNNYPGNKFDRVWEGRGDKVYHFDRTWIYPCGNPDWGYKTGIPCVILSYSGDPSYHPKPYEKLTEVPTIPKELREIAKTDLEDGGNFIKNLVRLHCTHVDIYNYAPNGFYSYFFPNSNVDGYLPPMASVRFNFLDDDDHIIERQYNVECSLWSQDPNPKDVKKVSFTIKQSKNC